MSRRGLAPFALWELLNALAAANAVTSAAFRGGGGGLP
jgi:hypothetical protein